MKKLLTLCVLLSSTLSFAQNQVQTETSNMISFASGHIMQLAEAIPEDKYDWSPDEGVRSVSGVLHHVISANYFFGTKMGGSLPSGVNMETLEQDLKTKSDLAAALKKSSDFIVATIKEVEDDALANKVEFPFPGEYTVMTAILIAQSHCNEHLGQLIAYGRMNGITPPWSQQ
jgi:uncharacterized damage-inducible protein DinB